MVEETELSTSLHIHKSEQSKLHGICEDDEEEEEEEVQVQTRIQ